LKGHIEQTEALATVRSKQMDKKKDDIADKI
jgi:hypothetical protein